MRFSQKKLSLILVLCIGLIDFMGIGLVYPMFSSMLFNTEFHLLPADTSYAVRGSYLGVLLAMNPAVQFFSAPLLGAWSDQKGRKPVFIITLLVGVLGYIVAFFSVVHPNLLILLFSRVLIGISAGNSAVVAACISDLSTSESKARNFGLFAMVAGIGFTIGPFLGGKFSEFSLFEMQGFAIPFALSAFVTLLNLLLVLLYFQETHSKKIKKKLDVTIGVRNVKKAFRMPEIRSLLISVFILSFGWSFFYEFAPVTWITYYYLSPSSLGMLYAFGALFYAISSAFLIKPIVKRFSDRRVFFVGLILTGTCIFLFLIKPSYVWLWPFLALVNFFVSLLYPTSTTLVSNQVGEDMQGEVLGIYQSMESAAFALSPLISGALIGMSFNMPMLIGGTCMLVSAAIIGKAMKKKLFK